MLFGDVVKQNVFYFPGAGPLGTDRPFTSDIEDKAPSFNACPRGR